MPCCVMLGTMCTKTVCDAAALWAVRLRRHVALRHKRDVWGLPTSAWSARNCGLRHHSCPLCRRVAQALCRRALTTIEARLGIKVQGVAGGRHTGLAQHWTATLQCLASGGKFSALAVWHRLHASACIHAHVSTHGSACISLQAKLMHSLMALTRLRAARCRQHMTMLPPAMTGRQ